MLFVQVIVLYALLKVAQLVSDLPSMTQLQMHSELVVDFLVAAIHELCLFYLHAHSCQMLRCANSLVKSIDACTCTAESDGAGSVRAEGTSNAVKLSTCLLWTIAATLTALQRSVSSWQSMLSQPA